METNKLSNNQLLMIKLLKQRFIDNPLRHENIKWEKVAFKLVANPNKLDILAQMEATGGEPDVVFYNQDKNCFSFIDCSAESPIGRRNLCYDEKARLQRKHNRPLGSVMRMTSKLHVQLLTVKQYQYLQTLGVFDTKTSSWLQTPTAIYDLGGALFGDRRYNEVFVYHNGAQSYYQSRGFRACLFV